MIEQPHQVVDAVDIPVLIQDAPVSGTPLSASFLSRMAREIPNVAYFKIEVPMAAAKLRDLIALGGAAVRRSAPSSAARRRGARAGTTRAQRRSQDSE